MFVVVETAKRLGCGAINAGDGQRRTATTATTAMCVNAGVAVETCVQ
jgi:hypothetical protein